MVLDEDAEYDEMGARMYAHSLRQLTPYLSRPGHWRVRMNNVYEIMAVVPGGARGGPPQAGEFTFKVPGGGAVPTCGVLTRLTDAQAGYAFYMFNDLCKVARAKDLAHEDKLATNDSRLGDAHLADIREIVGELPPSEHEVRQAAREREAAEAAEAAARREREEREVQEMLGGLSLEAEFAKARKKAEKRARQKARQKAAKQGAAAPDAAADGDGGNDAGGAAGLPTRSAALQAQLDAEEAFIARMSAG